MTKISRRVISKYIVGGGSAFIAEYSTFVAIYALLGHRLIVANTISFCAGLLVSFLVQRLWTFQEAGNPYHHKPTHQLGMFTVLALFNLLASTGLIELSHVIGLPALVCKIFAMLVIAVWNFLVFNYGIFRKINIS